MGCCCAFSFEAWTTSRSKLEWHRPCGISQIGYSYEQHFCKASPSQQHTSSQCMVPSPQLPALESSFTLGLAMGCCCAFSFEAWTTSRSKLEWHRPCGISQIG